MSKRGYTGLVLRTKAKLGLFNSVKVYGLETFDTGDTITAYWHFLKRRFFKSRFSALRFMVKVRRSA